MSKNLIIHPSIKGIRNNSGYTFIELSVVILIISFILIIVAPKLGDFGKGDLKLATRRLASLIRYTRNQAAITKNTFQINYNIKTSEYWVSKRNQDGTFEIDHSILTGIQKLPDEIAFKDIVTPFSGKVIDGETYTKITSTGFVDRSVIHLIDDKKNFFTLIIKPLTGEIETFDDYIEEVRIYGSQ